MEPLYNNINTSNRLTPVISKLRLSYMIYIFDRCFAHPSISNSLFWILRTTTSDWYNACCNGISAFFSNWRGIIGILRGYAIRSGRRPEGGQRPPGGPQTSRGKSAAAGRPADFPYRVTTQYSFYPVQIYSLHNNSEALKFQIQWLTKEWLTHARMTSPAKPPTR